MMKKKPAGSQDVAKLAGVSRSAVSRTYTPGAYVSEETRAKVLAAAAMLDYSPNAIARSLSKSRSGLIGIIASTLDNPFYARLLELLASTLQARGYAALLMVGDARNMDELLAKLLSYQVDGVLLPASKLTSRMAVSLHRSGRPVVLVNHTLDSREVSSVSGDNYGGGRMVADLLWETGHRRIAYVSGPIDTSSAVDRGRGLQDRLREYGIGVHAQASGEDTREQTAVVVRQMLNMTPPPDAIFCANDTMAVAALEVVTLEYGLRVPDDIAIVGYDNTILSTERLHALTSVDQNLEQMAQSAVDMLIRKMASDAPDLADLSVPATLIRRSTTRPRD
ncbi:MAG: LacI family DNA-binding transcriptional regulator [Devosia sp.]|nr:LacI family DNA-binding transcriptional regulator [Devosia sp.]